MELRIAIDRLSARERQILKLSATGKNSQAIAGELGISPRTVDPSSVSAVAIVRRCSCRRPPKAKKSCSITRPWA